MRILQTQIPLWIAIQGMLVTGIALTVDRPRTAVTLAFVGFVLTFLSHDFRGRRRTQSWTAHWSHLPKGRGSHGIIENQQPKVIVFRYLACEHRWFADEPSPTKHWRSRYSENRLSKGWRVKARIDDGD
jgi:hypothetical protein